VCDVDPDDSLHISCCVCAALCVASLTCRKHTNQRPEEMRRFSRGDRDFMTWVTPPLQLTCLHITDTPDSVMRPGPGSGGRSPAVTPPSQELPVVMVTAQSHLRQVTSGLSLSCHDPPSSPMIYTRDKVELGVKNTLICHVSGFYPAPVNVSWTKNEQKVTEGTSINVPFPLKDGSFNQISRLEFIPQLGDVYTCTVRHPALNQPLARIWDVEVQQPSIGPAVFCGVGLTVGLLGVAAGTFFLIKGNECS
ncbi:HLA class II histocompatibility antigen, DP alpha 1 chain-like protein, partial [Lates japonicus]